MEAVSREIVDVVLGRLHEIECEHDVEILLAVESGSRAWGFASLDSDYDVRFIYRHRMSWYLDVLQRRDVIEYPIVDEMDYSGWDLRKMLFLLNKSNPVLFEWFHSPIVYRSDTSFLEAMKEPFDRFFSPVATVYHYLHMAENNYREYLKRDRVKVKKYFYVLRPLFACAYIERYKKAPPIQFDILLETAALEPSMQSTVIELLERKKQGNELGEEDRIEPLNRYIERQLDHFRESVSGFDPREKLEPEYLNRVFAEMMTGSKES